MGLLLLKDSLIYYVMKAREKWLKPEGIILPDKSTIYISSIKSSKHTIRPSISSNFWTSVYDIDMTVIREEVARNVVNTKCDADLILSSISKVYEIDMYTVREEDLSFASKYDLTIEKNDRINGIIAWFDVYFEKIPNKVYFTTSPFNKMTLYKQCVLLMDEEEIVLKGEKLRGSIALKNNIRDPNNFSMFTGIKMSFHFDGKITKKDYIKYFKLK